MTIIIQSFFLDMLESAFGLFDGLMVVLIENMLYIERMMAGVFSVEAINLAYNFIYGFAVSLIVLKFLQRGFYVYVLWKDGDADNSVGDMLMGVVQAIVIIIGFPFLYDKICEVAIWFITNLQTFFKLDFKVGILPAFGLGANIGLIQIIIALIFVIMAFVLWLKLLQRGIELLILRISLPIACIGLIDSDGGIFKGFISQLFKTVTTTILQVFLMGLSFKAVLSWDLMGIILGIAIVIVAFNAPTILQSFLINTAGSGGVTNKIYTGARMVNMARGMFK